MNAVHKRCSFVGLAAFALTLLQACVVEGVGVDGPVGVGYVGDYYEPYSYGYGGYGGYGEYGGWGGGYRVGPGWGGDRRGDRGGGVQPSRSYRPAPASRATPSIPRGSRGGSHGH